MISAQPDSILKNTVNEPNTRMIVMGQRPLVESFSLLGFETWTDASEEDLQQLLTDLVESDNKALILLESYLSQSSLAILSYVRAHGGRIIVTEIPSLNAPQEYHPYVEDLVVQVLGEHVLNDPTSSESEYGRKS